MGNMHNNVDWYLLVELGLSIKVDTFRSASLEVFASLVGDLVEKLSIVRNTILSLLGSCVEANLIMETRGEEVFVSLVIIEHHGKACMPSSFSGISLNPSKLLTPSSQAWTEL